MDVLSQQRLPSPSEQADLLLLLISGKAGSDYGRNVNIGEAEVSGHIGSLSSQTTRRIRDHLIDEEYIDKNAEIGHYRLTVKGWKRIHELRSGHIMSSTAFMAMQYGDAELDWIYLEIFKPAVARAGFKLLRLDDQPRSGLIDDRLRVEIANSRFLVADLTHHNNGAYWEAGFAEGLGKPVIYSCEKTVFDGIAGDGRPTHFDTNHHLNVIWERGNLEMAASKLVSTIRATLPGEAKMIDGP